VYGKVKAVTRKSDPTTKLPLGNKPNLVFEYDASGNRVTKTSIKGADVTKTYYIRDASGNVMSTYTTSSTSSLTLGEQYLYGSSRLGVLENGSRSYELTDHLGNVRAVVDEFKEVKAAYEYYAFGMSLAKYEGKAYRYGFNGKERDTEGMGGGGATYDYGYRIYNPQIAKFTSVDPLFKGYAWYTPYQFAGNKPIVAVDLDGLEEAPSNNKIKKSDPNQAPSNPPAQFDPPASAEPNLADFTSGLVEPQEISLIIYDSQDKGGENAGKGTGRHIQSHSFWNTASSNGAWQKIDLNSSEEYKKSGNAIDALPKIKEVLGNKVLLNVIFVGHGGVTAADGSAGKFSWRGGGKQSICNDPYGLYKLTEELVKSMPMADIENKVGNIVMMVCEGGDLKCGTTELDAEVLKRAPNQKVWATPGHNKFLSNPIIPNQGTFMDVPIQMVVEKKGATMGEKTSQVNGEFKDASLGTQGPSKTITGNTDGTMDIKPK